MQYDDRHNGFALLSIVGLCALTIIAFFTSMQIGITLVVISR
jgi:hypothetical protein